MPQEYGAQAERPDEQVPAADQPDHRSQDYGRDHVIFIQPAQLGKFCEIADVVEARVVVFIGHDPADVRPEKSKQCGRMKVQFLIGMAMMMAMMRRPPQYALLRRAHGHERDYELKDAAGFKRAVRKIAVISGSNEKHAHAEERQTSHQVVPMKRNEKYQQ